MADIKKVSVKHEAILDYLLANPAERLSVVACTFGVSQPWLSTIIHSDAFQAKLKEKSGEMFGETIIPLREKLLGIAHVGVEKLGDAMEHASVTSEKEYIADTTDMILKNLGYSPKGGPSGSNTLAAQQNNYYLVDSGDLAEARDKMRQVHSLPAGPTPPAPESSAKGVTLDQSKDTPAEGV